MKNVFRGLLILALLNAPAFAQVILPTHISGGFSVSEWFYYDPAHARVDNPDFPNGVHASFSFNVDVPQQGAFENPAVVLDTWTPDPFTIGTTNLTRGDLGAYASFQDGILQFLIIGGLLDGVNAVSSHGLGAAPSDFMFIYTPSQGGVYFGYQADGEFAQVQGNNIQAWVDVSQAQAVPESSAIGVVGALFLLGLVVKLRMISRTRH